MGGTDSSDNLERLTIIGCKWITNGQINKQIRDNNPPTGWRFGRVMTWKAHLGYKHSDETKNKISLANRKRT
jgi:hypothetical protein